MDAERWQQAKALFAEAVEQPPEHRAAFVAAQCAGDAALEQEVTSLLDAFEAAGDDDGPPGHPPLARRDGTWQAGSRIGPYEIEELVGRGGMGAVYRAVRADGQFEHHVALKLVDRAVPGGDLLARFLSERRILARLQHPHIARLLDGGVTEASDGRPGVPYLAMEFVEGQPLTDYCEVHGLGLQSRLLLMRQVCSAVAYAHRNLVVHRDLKPGNVLVVEGDGEPRVKLLDFGIAKLLDDDETGPQTRTGERLLTPDYAAPEQLRGEVVTTSADVYALGVLLYELLAGRRPFSLRGLSAAEMERVVSQQLPERPSRVRTQTGEGSDTSRHLRGDLDQIVLKALHKEPERRYASVEALDDDLRRHLEGLPVQARPDTLSYRAAKFIGRHRVGVASAVLLLVVLVGGIVATGTQAARARAEAARAEETNRFLLDLLASADPEAEGRTVTVASLLDAAAREADARFVRQPALEASVRHTLGQTYNGLGLFDEALAQLSRALALRRGLRGPVARVHEAETLSLLGRVQQKRGEYEAALPLLEQALALQQRWGGEAGVAAEMSNLGVYHWEMGHYGKADTLLNEAFAIERRVLGEDHERVALTLDNLATVAADQGDEARAEGLYRQSLAIVERRFGESHPRTAQSLAHLGILRHDLGDLREAESLHRRALRAFRATRGEAHSDVGYALNNLSTVLVDLDSLDRAEALQREGLEIYRGVLGDAHANTGIQLNNLAYLLRKRGKQEEALETYGQAVAVWRAALPPDHPYLAYGLHNVGTVRMALARDADAEAPLREALAIREAALPPGHAETLTTMNILGECLGRLGRAGEAERLLVESYRGLLGGLGADHALTQQAAERVTTFFQQLGRGEEAARLLTPVSE